MDPSPLSALPNSRYIASHRAPCAASAAQPGPGSRGRFARRLAGDGQAFGHVAPAHRPELKRQLQRHELAMGQRTRLDRGRESRRHGRTWKTEILRHDPAPSCGDHSPAQGLFQLPDVPRPSVAGDGGAGARRHALHGEPMAPALQRDKCSARSGTSAGRSRRAGTARMTLPSRSSRSARNSPRSTAPLRSRLVAAIRRTSTWTVVVDPTGQTSRPWRKRKSIACPCAERSPPRRGTASRGGPRPEAPGAAPTRP
jgi:hypothetical protein